MEGGLDGEAVDFTKQEFSPSDIFNKVREVSKERKFVESFEVQVKLNVDPAQGD